MVCFSTLLEYLHFHVCVISSVRYIYNIYAYNIHHVTFIHTYVGCEFLFCLLTQGCVSCWKLTGWGGARGLPTFPQASSSCGVPVPLEFPSLAWDWLCLTSSLRRAEEESQVSPAAGGGACPGLQGGPRSPGRAWGTEVRRHGEGKPRNASGNGRGFAGGEMSEGEEHRSPGPAVPAGGDQPGAGI